MFPSCLHSGLQDLHLKVGAQSQKGNVACDKLGEAWQGEKKKKAE